MQYTELIHQLSGDLGRITLPTFYNFIKIFYNNNIFRAIVHYRVGIYVMNKKRRIPLAGTIMNILTYKKVKITFSTANIGPGLLIYHGTGITLGSGVQVGKNLTLLHDTTIGNRIGSDLPGSLGFPKLGDNVFIGCGAKIIGPIKIGNNVKIGANAVVISDIPDNATVVGVPAKLVKHGLADTRQNIEQDDCL